LLTDIIKTYKKAIELSGARFFIEEENAVEEVLRKLVSFPTKSGDHIVALSAMRYIAAFVQERGMYVDWFESNKFPSFVATTRPHDLTPQVLLVAHVDVVPAPQSMFVMRTEGDKYVGRGVYDMKFGIASFMQLIDDLKDDLATYDFGLMITSDEEVGGRNGVKYLVEHEGYKPKVCIIPDAGDNWHIETFEKGVQWIKLEATGTAAHASRPWEGEHAVHKLLAALADIRNVFPVHIDKKGTVLSVGTIKGGETANQIADYAEAMLDIRTGSRAEHTQIFPVIEQICRTHSIQATLLVDDVPCVNDLTNPFIACFKDILVDAIGEWPGTTYSYAVTDGRFFSALGIPCIITMPPGGGWHGEAEWVSVEGCRQYCSMLRQYLEAVARKSVESVTHELTVTA